MAMSQALAASSATSERLFSCCGNVVVPIRPSLEVGNVSAMVYLHKNLGMAE